MRHFKFANLIFLFLLAACCRGYSTHSEMNFSVTGEEKPATIKVLLKQNIDGALIEVKGSYKVYNVEKNKYLSSGFKGKRFYLFPHSDGIKWGEVYPGIYQIRLVPTSADTTILVDGIEYRGCMEIYNIDNKVHIVNEIDVESYIKSTLSSCFIDGVSKNILDAVAIVARTDAYYLALKNHDSFWHVKSDQVKYYGNANTLINPFIDRAVDATKYLVMIYNEGPFPSTWTKNCAGKTAAYSAVFRKRVKVPDGVEAVFAKKDRNENIWTYKMDKEKFAKLMKINRVTGIELFTDPFSAKIYGIRIKDGNHQKDLDFFEMQRILGEKLIKSNDFTVRIEGPSILFQGYGEGCGTGLCLYSAAEMAKRGDLIPQILAEFFPYTRIQKMIGYPEFLSQKNIY